MEASVVFPADETLQQEDSETDARDLDPAIISDALETEILEKDFEGEEGEAFTQQVFRRGEAIGAAAVYHREVPISDDRVVRAVEIELVATDESNERSVYLALVTSIIAKDPQVREIDGVPGDKMAMIASEISCCLPQGWFCEYVLGNGHTDAATYDPQEMLQGAANGDTINHAFKRIHTV
jgi:hypothetical protein